ncbi:MAG: glycosyltransferase [Bacteroidetes bacterium]|nr:glycosyltransferase [Bacteroidota bacterium]
MAQKRILYITPAFPVGGAEKFLILLANSMVNGTEKQTVVSLSTNNVLHAELSDKITFVTLPRKAKFDPDPIRKLRKLIKAEDPDIIFCINFYTYFIVRCAVAALSQKAKRIISYHSTIHVSKKEHLLHKLYTAILSKKDFIITVSENQAKYTAQLYGLPDTKFKTIHNGIDTAYWRPASPEWDIKSFRAKLDLPAAAKVIIMTAALRPEKNHIGALEALKILHTVHHCKAYLLLVGDGVMKEQIKAKVSGLQLDEYVKFAGTQKEVRPFYWASDLFTLASVSVETFSIAALEAMSCGLPCVLTDIGGASEMVSNGVNGYLCKPEANDIAAAWFKALEQAFSKESIFSFTHDRFSAEKMVNQYEEFYAALN